MRTLVTGASGFVGTALIRGLHADGHHVVAAARQTPAHRESGVEHFACGELNEHTRWRTALQGAGQVVHLAARVHQMNDTATDPLAAFRTVNTAATLNLAQQAAEAGVERFVYLSSIKVNGEATLPAHRFKSDDAPAPVDPYGISKAEAEEALRDLASRTGMAVTIVRPPLVYGPGVKANFRALMRAVQRGLPLPLGAIDNRRSLVALDNLVDLIATCLRHPAAANETFLASDDDDLSTSDLIRRIGRAMGKPARLLPVPVPLLKVGFALLGKGSAGQRLCENLQVDISRTRALLDWTPPLTVDGGLRQATQALLAEGTAR